jgi:hypothetical protein
MASYIRCFDTDIAEGMFQYMYGNLDWMDGIKTRGGKVTRKAVGHRSGSDDVVDDIIMTSLKKFNEIGAVTSCEVLGTYINLYRDGNDWAPKHNHPGTKQMVISFGQTRTLTVGSVAYQMNSGEAIIFGPEYHCLEKDTSTLPRISVAVFIREL